MTLELEGGGARCTSTHVTNKFTHFLVAMKFIQRFLNRKKPRAEDGSPGSMPDAPLKVSARGTSNTSSATSSSTAPPQKPKNPFGDAEDRIVNKYRNGHIIKEDDHELIKVAKSFMAAIIDEKADLLNSLCNPGYEIHFVDLGGVSTLSELIGVVKMIRNSFPDLVIATGEYEVKPGREVHMGFHQVFGTHTGVPFSFGPFPPIAATGILCANDPESFIFKFDTKNRVKLVYIRGSGNFSGPPGLYMQIGGKLE